MHFLEALLQGAYFGKCCVSPALGELLSLNEHALDLRGHLDGIGEDVAAFFQTHGAIWKLRVLLCTDLRQRPVEDAATMWPEDLSLYVTVARMTAPASGRWGTFFCSRASGVSQRARSSFLKKRSKRLFLPVGDWRFAADVFWSFHAA